MQTKTCFPQRANKTVYLKPHNTHFLHISSPCHELHLLISSMLRKITSLLNYNSWVGFAKVHTLKICRPPLLFYALQQLIRSPFSILVAF